MTGTKIGTWVYLSDPRGFYRRVAFADGSHIIESVPARTNEKGGAEPCKETAPAQVEADGFENVRELGRFVDQALLMFGGDRKATLRALGVPVIGRPMSAVRVNRIIKLAGACVEADAFTISGQQFNNMRDALHWQRNLIRELEEQLDGAKTTEATLRYRLAEEISARDNLIALVDELQSDADAESCR